MSARARAPAPLAPPTTTALAGAKRTRSSEREAAGSGAGARHEAEKRVREALALPPAPVLSLANADDEDEDASASASASEQEEAGPGGGTGESSASIDPDDAEATALKEYRDISLRIEASKRKAQEALGDLETRVKQAAADLLQLAQESAAGSAGAGAGTGASAGGTGGSSGGLAFVIDPRIVEAKTAELATSGLAAMKRYVRVVSQRRPNKPITADIIVQAVEGVSTEDVLALCAKEEASDEEEEEDARLDAKGKVHAKAKAKVQAKAKGGAAGAGAEAGAAAKAKAKPKQPKGGHATLGEAYVGAVVAAVLELIRGALYEKAELTDKLGRGIKGDKLPPAPKPVVLVALALHELLEQRTVITRTRAEEIADAKEALAERAPLVTAFFERSGHKEQELRNPSDAARNVYIVPAVRKEAPRPVGIRIFKTLVETAVSEHFGNLREIRDVKTLMRAKVALLQNIKQQIAALEPVVRTEPPKLKHLPGPAKGSKRAVPVAGGAGGPGAADAGPDPESGDEEEEDDEDSNAE